MPAKFGAAHMAHAFFGGYAVLREQSRKPRHDSLLASPVRLSDEIDVAFISNFRRKRILFAKNFSGFERGFNSGVKIRLGHRNCVVSLNYQFAVKETRYEPASGGSIHRRDRMIKGTRCGGYRRNLR